MSARQEVLDLLKRVCSVDGCLHNQSPGRRGWCEAHYKRWYRYGDVHVSRAVSNDMSVEQRLRYHGWTVTASGCWEWNGGLSSKGYGGLWYKGVNYKTHRLAYETWVGPIPEGLHILHSCDNPPCINPEHLRPGTNDENVQDKMNRDRHGYGRMQGSRHGRSKLTEEEVILMRESHQNGIDAKQLAATYGVSPDHVRLILRRGVWRHV